MSAFSRVLVTGATGFIGARLCERLVMELQQPVRALIHSWRNAVRVAHLPVEMTLGDLENPASVFEAVRSCDAVIHLATGGRQGIVVGTRNLVAAARRLGVRRLIHMSTTAVHGLRPPASLAGEDTPLKRVGEAYCDWKINAERAVWAGVRRELPAVILRPCIVYGPWSRWNTNILERLSRGEYFLVDGGRGLCNTVYVDNLIDAIFAALVRDEATGQAFFITDEEPITWGRFVGAHAALLGLDTSLPSVTFERVLSYHRARGGLLRQSVGPFFSMLLSPAFRQLLQSVPLFDRALMKAAGRLSPERKVSLRRLARRGPDAIGSDGPMPDLATALVQSCEVRFSSAKAATRLGYAPRITFGEGMALTAQWLAWAGRVRPRVA